MQTTQTQAVTPPNNTELVIPEERAPTRLTAIRVKDEGPMSYLLDSDRFEHAQRIASVMSKSSLLPEHLQGKSRDVAVAAAQSMANCFRVVNQALRWGVDPFACIDETYEVHGKMGYQGKLIAAVINSKCAIQGGLRYLYNNKRGDDFAVVTFASEFKVTPEQFDWLVEYAEDDDHAALQELTKAGIAAVRVSVGQAKTDKNEMWKKDPEQKLSYNGALKWARRHAPQLVLGVMTDDDVDRMTAGLLPAEEGLATPRSLADLTASLKTQAISTTAADPEPQAAANSGPGPAAEQKSAEPKAAPGVVVDAGSSPAGEGKTPEPEPKGGSEEEGFALSGGTTPEGKISEGAAKILVRIAKVQSEGGLKRILADVMPSGIWTAFEKAEFQRAADARTKQGWGEKAAQ